MYIHVYVTNIPAPNYLWSLTGVKCCLVFEPLGGGFGAAVSWTAQFDVTPGGFGYDGVSIVWPRLRLPSRSYLKKKIKNVLKKNLFNQNIRGNFGET